MALGAVLMSASVVAHAQNAKPLKYYNYAHSDAEYVVSLPDAPLVETIWAGVEDKPVPHLTDPPSYGAVGETAKLTMREPLLDTIFDVKITLLRASQDFLLELERTKMYETLETEMDNIPIDDTSVNFSAGSSTLKWLKLSGLGEDAKGNPIIREAHYLVGQRTIMIMTVTYSVESKTYQDHYKKLAESIRFIQN